MAAGVRASGCGDGMGGGGARLTNEFANVKDASARRRAEEQGYPIVDEDEDGSEGDEDMMDGE